MSLLKGSEKTKLGITGGKSYGRSYGSTQMSKKETYLPHEVSRTDTLQGISLKYGVSVEQIKRANKLYTNDSIFLRSVLYIPVGNQPLPADVLENTVSSTNGSPLNSCSKEKEKAKEASDSDNEEEEEEPVNEDSLDKGMDFLNRIDRQIQIHKTEIKRVEENSSVDEIDAMSPPVRAPVVSPGGKSKNVSQTRGESESYQLGVVTVNMEDHLIRNSSSTNGKSLGSTSPVVGESHNGAQGAISKELDQQDDVV